MLAPSACALPFRSLNDMLHFRNLWVKGGNLLAEASETSLGYSLLGLEAFLQSLSHPVCKMLWESKACTRRSKPVNATWVQLVFLLVMSPGNWLYCSVFLTKLSCSSFRGEHYTSTYLYKPNVELSKKTYQVNTIRSVFPNPALIGINYIFLFNSVLRLSAIPAYCLGSATDGQTHHFCRPLCLSLKTLAQQELFSSPLIFTRSRAQEVHNTCSLMSCFASSECLDTSYLAQPV